MSKTRSKTPSSKKENKSFLERLPSNLPFLPIVRRPDYQLRFVRLSAPKSVPIQLIIALVFIGLFFIYIGGFYDLAQEPVPAFGQDPNTGEAIVIINNLNHQYLVEGLAAGFLMFIGAGGFFLIHYSTQYAYSPKNATILLILGIGVVVICWIAVTFMLKVKLG
ncbi:MAG: hypothetical protein ACTSXO_00755 [Candidatus Heimdallarchaeota archaeon]|nr:MAG: hypothetical protein DRP02_08360 [Candidatus Gerdarchaeota archaeon]